MNSVCIVYLFYLLTFDLRMFYLMTFSFSKSLWTKAVRSLRKGRSWYSSVSYMVSPGGTGASLCRPHSCLPQLLFRGSQGGVVSHLSTRQEFHPQLTVKQKPQNTRQKWAASSAFPLLRMHPGVERYPLGFQPLPPCAFGCPFTAAPRGRMFCPLLSFHSRQKRTPM